MQKLTERFNGVFDIGLIDERDFEPLEKREFPDLDYNIISMPYFNKNFKSWASFIYDMMVF